MDNLLWPGAVLDFDRIDLAHNVAALAEAAKGWSALDAVNNYRKALMQLDWRLRLLELVDRLGVDTPPKLASDIARLKVAASLN